MFQHKIGSLKATWTDEDGWLFEDTSDENVILLSLDGHAYWNTSNTIFVIRDKTIVFEFKILKDDSRPIHFVNVNFFDWQFDKTLFFRDYRYNERHSSSNLTGQLLLEIKKEQEEYTIDEKRERYVFITSEGERKQMHCQNRSIGDPFSWGKNTEIKIIHKK